MDPYFYGEGLDSGLKSGKPLLHVSGGSADW